MRARREGDQLSAYHLYLQLLLPEYRKYFLSLTS